MGRRFSALAGLSPSLPGTPRASRAHRRLGALLPLLLLGAAPAASAQVSSFATASYYPGAGRALYAGYGVARVFGVLGIEENPTAGYHEEIVGLGYLARLGPSAAARIALASSSTSDASYAKLYVLPFVAVRPVEVTAAVVVYQPLGASGRQQLYLSPLIATVGVVPGARVGAAYVFGAAGGVRTQLFGPSAALAIPHGSISLSYLAGAHVPNRFRLAFFAAL